MSRRVRLFIATSLDGYIAGPGDALDWLFTDEDYGYDAFVAGVGTVAMGRRTYDVVRGFGEWPCSGLDAWVFTRQDAPAADPRVRFTGSAPGEWLAGLTDGAPGDVWIMGGGELIRSCLDEQLVDDMTLSVHPVVLGGGVPLFPPGPRRHRLRLLGQKQFPSGLSQLTYLVQT